MRNYILISVTLLCLFFSCKPSSKSNPDTNQRPNIIVVLVDDMRWEEFGAAGHNYIKTPNIDRLAREGVRFKNAFATTPLCSPSRASFLTGQYPHTNGIVDNQQHDELSHRLETFPKLLQHLM